jgi:hypothetical protein
VLKMAPLVASRAWIREFVHRPGVDRMPVSSRRVWPWLLIPLAVCLAVWWGLRHPAVGSTPASRPPDPFEVRRRADAIALARMADDPGPAHAASAPASASGALWLSPFNNLTAACRDQAAGDAGLAQQCDRIGMLMFDHGDVYMAHMIGATLHRMATGDASLREQALAEQDAANRRARAEAPRFEALLSDCGAASHAIARRYRRIAEIGELEYQRERLRLGILY